MSAKCGYIEHIIIVKKKPVKRYMWFSLHGSTLVCYEDVHSSKPKTSFEIKDAVIYSKTEQKTIDVKKNEKLIVSLILSNKQEFASWLKVLQLAVNLDSCEPPTKTPVKKSIGSIGILIGRVFGDKMLTTAPGKAAVKNFLNEETRLLINSLKNMVAKVESQKIADEIEESLVKVVVKCYFLELDRKVAMDQFLEADEPLRMAFEILVEMRDRRHKMNPELVKQKLMLVHEKLTAVENIITGLLLLHFSVSYFIFLLYFYAFFI